MGNIVNSKGVHVALVNGSIFDLAGKKLYVLEE
jgi:hypothetical protein